MLADVKTLRTPHGNLFAVSDLHVNHPENRRVVQEMLPLSEHDWLIACGDVGESIEDVEWALGLLAERFDTVVWVPGNHELWSFPDDPADVRGQARYLRLVDICHSLDVLTPEDPYPVWEGAGGPMTIAPLFVLYDYTFGRNIAPTKQEALARAQEAGVVCSDEFLLHPDPFPSREAWCNARVRETEHRLTKCDPDIPTVLVNRFSTDLRRDSRVVASGVRAVVRHGSDRGLAPAVSRKRGRIRSSAYSPHHLARRRAIRGGFTGIST